MAERLAALGLRAPVKAGDGGEDRSARDRREKEERARQAEAEDAKRELERQRRLADEQITPPSASKRPPPPPSRRGRADSNKPTENATESTLREEESAQEAKVRALE